MRYPYHCDRCETTILKERSVAARDEPVLCPSCMINTEAEEGRLFLRRLETPFMRRLLCVPQLVTRRAVDEPDVKYALGFSSQDRLQFCRAEERRIACERANERIPDAPVEKPLIEYVAEAGYLDG